VFVCECVAANARAYTVVPAGPQNERRASWNADLFRQKRLLLFLHNHTNARILHAQLSRAGAAVAVAKSRDDFVRFLQLAEAHNDTPSGTHELHHCARNTH